MLPHDYIVHLEDKYCPLDKQAEKEVQDHYFRGGLCNQTPNPNRIKIIAKGVEEEQAVLLRDGVTITGPDNTSRYFLRIYRSGAFPHVTICTQKKKPVQTYANTKTHFQ